MENQVIVSDYTQMDRVLREERNYILDIVKKIKKVGCNVLLIQKSILRSGVTDFLRETLIPLSHLKNILKSILGSGVTYFYSPFTFKKTKEVNKKQ